MGFWGALISWIVTTLVYEVFRPKPDIEDARPAGLGDFNFPTVGEGRPIPLCWGRVRLRAPNIIWSGDLAVEPKTQKVKTGLFSSDRVTTGFEYSLGVQFALCHGTIDAIRSIWAEDVLLWSGDHTTEADLSVSEPEFYGGDDPSQGGGFVGDFAIRQGGFTQSVVSYLEDFQNVQDGVTVDTPAYRGTAHAVLKGGYIGNRPRIDPLHFEVEKYPTQLWDEGDPADSGDSIINSEDANPVAILYEVLRNDDYGFGRPAARIFVGDVTKTEDDSFGLAAATVKTEGLGFSMVWDRGRPAEDLIEEILRHIDGVLWRDPVTNLLKITLIRKLQSTAGLPVFDQTNIASLENYTRPDWSQTVNHLAVRYEDRAAEYTTRHALAQDMANEQIQQKPVTSTIAFPGCKRADTANTLVWREIRSEAIPRAQGTITVDRVGYDLNPGSAFVLNWPKLSISNQICRITQMRPGTMEDGRIKIEFVEDVFAIQNTAYADPLASEWVPPSTTPAAALRERLWEVPLQLSPGGIRHLATLATRDGGNHQGYEVWLDPAGGSNYEISNTNPAFTPSGLLQGAYGRDQGDTTPYLDETGFTVDGLSGATTAAIEALSATTIADNAEIPTLVLVDEELMWFESATDNLDGSVTLENVHRGMFDTIVADHSDDAEVWFIGRGLGTATPEDLAFPVGAGTSVNVKILPYTTRETLAIGSASVLNITITDRYLGDVPPADPQLDGELFIDDDGWTALTIPVTLSWKRRNPAIQDFDTDQDDVDVTTQQSGVSYNYEVRQVSDDSLVDSGSETGTSIALSGLVNGTDYYVLFKTVRNGVDSQEWRSPDFTANT